MRTHSVAAAIESLLFAARLEHLIAIGGPRAKKYLFSRNCTLTPDHIARLCRRMPPFIQVKLNELETGGTDIDSNPTGAKLVPRNISDSPL